MQKITLSIIDKKQENDLSGAPGEKSGGEGGKDRKRSVKSVPGEISSM